LCFHYWSELDAYLKGFCWLPTSKNESVSPFCASLSGLIGREVNLGELIKEAYITYSMELIGHSVYFKPNTTTFDSALYVLEILNNKVVSGMVCTEHEGKYKITNHNKNNSNFIMIGQSLKIIGEVSAE
jgi:hypothetical protein